ncbi:hypothetical protein [Flammeovirga kamogawensis]|uniref:Energy transducer TonB n=1 Tax=Flammeovirga kamogawensis TaxID=373891 RepID=A0ABX8GWU9_9BACT|nr:hypothetical protein [Flammeovirga kamogawensis]MBB6460526.1 hypothetical protein [Flammeovirga kamogawensis]QWG07889.1 hypothetical protein KM029_02825 [Flammeovirga kamogawensis]TRX69695.1 hypothetical protein EO216_16755 [Flammeovirga kamogawensis]
MEKSPYEIKQDKKNRNISILVTLLSIVIILVIAWFTIVWSPPDPPIPQYGIEVNFGIDDAGFGKQQEETPTTSEENSLDEPKPSPEVEEQAPPQEIEETIEEPEPPAEVEPTPDPVEETTQQPTAVTDAPIEESVETVEKPKVVVKKVEKKQPDPKEDPKPVEKKETSPPKVEKPNTSTLMAKPDGSTGKTDASKQNNNGDVEGAKGDQGSKHGTVNADALMDSKGGSGGSALNMPGWNWIDPPNVVDDSHETGKIVFEIQVDDFGEVISVKTLFRSVTKQVVDKYKSAVEQLAFEPTSTEGVGSSITAGRITFIIRSK